MLQRAGYPLDSVVKGVVLKSAYGFMLALLPASRHIRFDELRQLLGTGVDIAGEEQIEMLFPDCEPGSVPALGAAYGLGVVIVYFEGRDHAHLVHISGTSFRKLMEGARHGRFIARSCAGSA